MSYEQGQWTYNSTDYSVWNRGEYFDTKEEAIEEAKQHFDDSFCVGQITPITSLTAIDVDRILEDIAMSVYDEVGEAADDYLQHVVQDHKDVLERKINKVVSDWMRKFEYEPSYFKVENIEKVSLN